MLAAAGGLPGGLGGIESQDLGDFLERRDSGASGSSHLLDKLMGEESVAVGDFLKDLISAKGLKSAWADLAKRMRGLEKNQVVLENLASRQALNRDYVTRPEYQQEVQTGVQGQVATHAKKLTVLETASSQAHASIGDHRKQLKDLEDARKNAVSRMDVLGKNLQRVEDQDLRNHEQVLALDRAQEERCCEREAGAKANFELVRQHLSRHDEGIQVLQNGLKNQEDFLKSDKLRNHIRHVCFDLLTDYVLKVEMVKEAAAASANVIVPVRDCLHELLGRFEAATARLDRSDDELRQHLEEASLRTASLTKDVDSRFKITNEQVQLRSTLEALSSLDAATQLATADTEERMQQLKKETVNKMQELNTRVVEFQILLEDHEHALQHHAEELLNRSTKYDLVVCQQRIDQCAIKDKVEKEIKEMQTTVEWQTSQLEVLGYGRSFGGAAVTQRPDYIMQGQRSGTPETSEDRTASPPADVLPGEADGILEGALPGNESLADDGDDTTAGVAAATGGSHAGSSISSPTQVPQRPASKLSDAGVTTRLPMVAQHPQHLQHHQQHLQHHGHSHNQPQTTEVYNLLRMQLEALAQAVLSLGRLSNREVPFGLSRECRKQLETELLEHLSCLLHWISHRRAPFIWKPDRLASLALRCMPGGDPNFSSEGRPATGRSGEGRPATGRSGTVGEPLGGCSSARPSRTGGAAASCRGLRSSPKAAMQLTMTAHAAVPFLVAAQPEKPRTSGGTRAAPSGDRPLAASVASLGESTVAASLPAARFKGGRPGTVDTSRLALPLVGLRPRRGSSSPDDSDDDESLGGRLTSQASVPVAGVRA